MSDDAEELFLHIEGTFGSGTVTVESREIGETGDNPAPVLGASFTSDVGTGFKFHPRTKYRFKMDGATSPNVTCKVH